MTNLFSSTVPTVTAGGANQLQKTALLTTAAEAVTNSIMKVIESNQDEYTPLVKGSQTSHDEMDKLVAKAYDLNIIDISFLKEETDDNIEKMLRSQQSKRSRTKGKAMTMDNYKSMMTAAIAEQLLRIASNKPKSSVGGGNRLGTAGYTGEQLDKLAADKELLGKEIRNVQSKKSIMKSKIGFDTQSERWLQLLEDEETLKNLRGNATTVTVVDERATQIEELLLDVTIHSLKLYDAKLLLTQIADIITPKVADADFEAEGDVTDESNQ